MIIIPNYLIKLNINFGYPVYDSLFLDFLGIIFILIGIGLFIYSTFLFKIFGKGTPAPIEPPKKLVINGLYKITRNPIYIGYILILFGELLYFGPILLLIYLISIIILINIYLIFYEEPILEKRFGKRYKTYINNVPRWFFK